MPLLDLPSELLQLTATLLGTEDRRSLALTCHRLVREAVRPSWRTLVLETRALPRRPPPAGLAACTGVQRVVLCRGRYHPGLLHPSSQDGRGSAAHTARAPEDIDVERLAALLCQLSALLCPALHAGGGCGGRAHARPLVLTCLLPHGVEMETLEGLVLQCTQRCLPASIARQLGDALHSRDGTPLPAAAAGAAPSAPAGNPGALLVLRVKRLCLGGPWRPDVGSAAVPRGSPRQQGPPPSPSLPPPFTALEVRHAVGLQGACRDVLVAASACWSPSDAASWRAPAVRPLHLAPYTRLQRLCLTVPRTSDPEAPAKLTAFLSTQLPTLCALTALQLGRPPAGPDWLGGGPPLRVALGKVTMPQLQRLELDEQVTIGAFEELTHLAALSSITLSFPGAGGGTYLGSVGALSALPLLRQLTLGNWRPAGPGAGLSSLKQLTALHLLSFNPPPDFCLAGRLPGVLSASLCCCPPVHGCESWMDVACPVLDWGMRVVCHAPLDLLRVQDLHLRLTNQQVQPLRRCAEGGGTWRRAAVTLKEVEEALAAVDSQALFVLGAARGLRQLTIDVWLSEDLPDTCGGSDPMPGFWKSACQRVETLYNVTG